MSSHTAKTASQPPAPRRHSHTGDKVFRGVATFAGVLILAVLAAVAVFLLVEASPVFTGDSSKVTATIESFTGGQAHNFWQYVAPLIFGTVLVAALALVLAFFVAIGISLFISQYAPKKLATVLNYVIDLLAAIPSVVYGLWGGLVLVPHMYGFWSWVNRYLGWIPLFGGDDNGNIANPPRTIATVSLVLAVMILPIITSMSRDVFMRAPRLQKEAALALGATKWEAIKLAVLPFGRSGVVSASMLGLGRALGETMAVLMILSPGRTFSWHLLLASRQQTIAANIAAQFAESDSLGVSVLIASGLVLFVITFIVNYVARKITDKEVK